MGSRKNMEGKVIAITGASSGIGKELAYTFASKGHNLLLTARREDLLIEIKEDIGSRYSSTVAIIPFDLSIEKELKAFYMHSKQFELDCFINNAGFGDFNFTWEMPVEKAARMVDLNIKSLTMLSLLFTQDYADKNAQLINVASIAGYEMGLKAVTYCASNFFVTSFTEGLDAELKQFGKKMRAKVLAPKQTQSEFFTKAFKETAYEFTLPDENGFMTSKELAEHAYELYESEKTVGVANPNSFDFVNPVHKLLGKDYKIGNS